MPSLSHAVYLVISRGIVVFASSPGILLTPHYKCVDFSANYTAASLLTAAETLLSDFLVPCNMSFILPSELRFLYNFLLSYLQAVVLYSLS